MSSIFLTFGFKGGLAHSLSPTIYRYIILLKCHLEGTKRSGRFLKTIKEGLIIELPWSLMAQSKEFT